MCRAVLLQLITCIVSRERRLIAPGASLGKVELGARQLLDAADGIGADALALSTSDKNSSQNEHMAGSEDTAQQVLAFPELE